MKKINAPYYNGSNSEFKDTITNHDVLSKHFDKNDYKIVFMGYTEAIKERLANTKAIEELIRNSTHANIIIM